MRTRFSFLRLEDPMRKHQRKRGDLLLTLPNSDRDVVDMAAREIGVSTSALVRSIVLPISRAIIGVGHLHLRDQ